MQLVISRIQENQNQTIGRGELFNNHIKLFDFVTLELPWRNNEKNISRIPDNHYKAVKHQSPKFGNSIWIQNVSDRSEILVHRGNYNIDTLGCILVGREFKDINKDGLVDITHSKATMEKLYSLCDNTIYVNILDEFE